MSKELKATKLDIDGDNKPDFAVTPIVDDVPPAPPAPPPDPLVVPAGGNEPGVLPPSQQK